jgi:hypothetical protein
METIHLASATGEGKDVRATIAGENVTLEWRSQHAWIPLTIGELHALLSARNGMFAWLEGLGVLWGAWVGRGADEIATFGRIAQGVPRPKRERRAPVFRVRSARSRVA